MDEQLDEQIDEQMDERMKKWKDVRMDRWMLDARTEGQMDGNQSVWKR